jgi:Tfp pilus assembly pilus retraction ATPase PilT
MSLLHARFLEPEALRGHLRAESDPALAATTDTGPLDDAAAGALAAVILRAGEPGGVIDLEGAEEWEARFLLIASLALGDGALAAQLLEGGWLDRRGLGAFAFGALPLRVLARQLTRESLRAAREAVQAGWESELLNVLESGSLRAARAAEEHLLLVRKGLRSGRAPSRPVAARPSLASLLAEAREQGATDLSLTGGLPPTLHGAFGSRPLGDVALSADDVADLVNPVIPPALLGARGPIVHTLSSRELGRFRVTVTTERAERAASFRVLFNEVPTLDGLGLSPLVQGPLLRQTRGLVLISGEPGSGRSTLYTALLQRLAHEGRHVASLEEPLGLPLTPGPGAARQSHLGVDTEAVDFARATRLQPLDVIGFDLVDDVQGLEHALEAAADGRLAVCVFRAPSVASAIHRASVLDARHHRRRLAEGLTAFMFQRLEVLDSRYHLEVDFHLPSVALRRHLRAHETPPPPIAFEDEDVG